jgi:hypothetical protein
VRVNLLSAVSSAAAVLFTYLITVRVSRKNWPDAGWLVYAGGVVGALFMAWGTTFWDNAIEAEVYASASAIMCFCVWLALRWWDGQQEVQNDRILWLILYVLFLAIGIHLGSFLVFPCIYLLVTMVHWDRVKKGPFLVVDRHLPPGGVHPDGDPHERPPAVRRDGALHCAGLVQDRRLVHVAGDGGRRGLERGVGPRHALRGWGSARWPVLGVSVHFYLLLRAQLNPAINEADPATWDALKLVLTRDQYKPPEPIFRKANMGYQFSQMYWRYFQWQFELFKAGNLPTYWIPILLGVFGAVQNWFREKKSFWLLATLYLITGPFLVYYLNFKEGEVRERDYFFVANFHFFAIWIGMGAVGLARMLAGPEEAVERKDLFKPAVVGVTVLAIVLSVLPLAAGEENQNLFRPQPARQFRGPRLRAQHAGGPRKGRHPLHERRQRHLPALVHAGGGALPEGRPGGEPLAAPDELVHQAAPRLRAQGTDAPGRRPDRGAPAVPREGRHDRLRERPHGRSHPRGERLQAPDLLRGDGARPAQPDVPGSAWKGSSSGSTGTGCRTTSMWPNCRTTWTTSTTTAAS